MKHIQLSNERFAIVDDEDFDRLSSFRWSADMRGKSVYVSRCVQKQINGKRSTKKIYMHRQIIGDVPSGFTIDHINRNPMDNRRRNLRVCTMAENSRNKTSINKSGKRGVAERPGGRFIARIKFNKQAIHIGTFDTAEIAARAYDQKAKELFGEFANLNFPDNE